MVDHVLKISRPGVFTIGRLNWNNAAIIMNKWNYYEDDNSRVSIPLKNNLGLMSRYLVFYFQMSGVKK